jgi:outer membrane immunogenic protein
LFFIVASRLQSAHRFFVTFRKGTGEAMTLKGSLAVVFGLIAAPAFAADMAVKATPAVVTPAAEPSWEGFYVGADIGLGMGVTKTTEPIQGDYLGSRGGVLGLLAGYNHMLAPRWLVGVEADANWSDLNHTETDNDGFGDVAALKLAEKEAYSARGRFGYLLAPDTLIYGTGGWSWSRLDYSLTSTFGASEAAKLALGGPEVGFGVETMLGAGWAARLEYLESFYNNVSFNSTALGTAIVLRPAIGVGRLALIYRFGAGDAATRNAPSPTPAPSWNGPYVAGMVAAATGTAAIVSSVVPGNSINGVGASAVLPTMLAGYNWRIAPRWVIGADVGTAPGISATELHVDWTEAAHGRVGYLLTPATLLYGSVGWFGTGFHTTALSDRVTVPSQRLDAMEVGAGVDAAIDDHWAVRFEYQYGFAQTIHDITLDLATGPLAVDARPQIQSAQVGVVYMFGGG